MEKRDYAIIGSGILTSVLAIFLNDFLLQKDFGMMSWLVWGFVPIGAILMGGLSAMGFLVSALVMQKRMSLLASIIMAGILVPAYFGHYYVQYDSLLIQDERGTTFPLSEELSFQEYYQWELTGRVYTGLHDTEEQKAKAEPVGNWGYLIGVMEIVCFLVGGLGVLGILSSMAYCRICHRYFKDFYLGTSNDDSIADATLQAMSSNDEIRLCKSLESWRKTIRGMEAVRSKRIFTLFLNCCAQCKENSVVQLKGQAQFNQNIKVLASQSVTQATAQKLYEIARP